MPRSFRFDKAYYDRFYGDRVTRVSSSDGMRRLGAFVCSYLAHIGQPVNTVIDMGCGVGAWRREIARHHPRAEYTGVEISRHACREHGWNHGSVVDYEDGHSYDLVICQSVLQYLDARSARRAIANLQRLGHGAVFVEALTREDWIDNCDRAVTDGDVYLRPAAWYREELAKYFTNCGGGVFLNPASPAVLYELEKLE